MNLSLRAQKTLDLKMGASQLPRELRRALFVSAIAIAGATVVAFVSSVLLPLRPEAAVTDYFFRKQDLFWLIAIASLLFGCVFLRLPTTALASLPSDMSRFPRFVTFGLAAATFLCGGIGSSLVFDNFHLARDEVNAEFDAMIFRSGQLIAPVDPEWRRFALPLAPRFMLPIMDNLGFASQYLPGNALLRALVGMWANPNLTSPLLMAVAVVAIYGVVRRLWPDRDDVAIIAPLLLATSSQALVASMTSYAMSAHLALNLVWLWLFLRDDKIGHGGAIAAGALACGLHQVIFHPLFVAPFILRLWFAHRRILALVYIVAYALICLFWITYPQLALHHHGMAPESASGAGLLNFIERAATQVTSGETNILAVMLMNILRLIGWQNPLVLPLALLAYGPIRNGTGIARELAAGVVLTLYVMTVVLPFQGHGWGYRYFHGLLGNMALLAAYGWVSVTARASQCEAAASRFVVAITSAFAVLVLFPAHAKDAHDFASPYARASAAIGRAPTDVVIVDKTGLLFGEDLARNDPFLRNKPKVLDLTYIDEASLPSLCQRYSVSFFDLSQGYGFGIGRTTSRRM